MLYFFLENLSFHEWLNIVQALYVHIPFCIRKCGYCDFYSEVANDQEMEAFLQALEQELHYYAQKYQNFQPRTIFFGGGTPTKLGAKELQKLGKSIHGLIDLSKLEEWSCEINPGTLDREKAQVLVDMGVNRASFGVQSFNPQHLKELDREHEAGKVQEAFDCASKARIKNISFDLIFGLPTQTLQEWATDLEQALRYKTQHLSLYALTYEEHTPLTRALEAGEITAIDPEREAKMYQHALEKCRDSGFARYEVSNFALPGFESKHNLLYWQCGDWLGIGPSAHSAEGKKRWANISDHRLYTQHWHQKRQPLLALEEENSHEAYGDEILMMGLRTSYGVNAADFLERTGLRLEERCGPVLDELQNQGLLDWNGKSLRATEQGILLLDAIILELTRTPMNLC